MIYVIRAGLRGPIKIGFTEDSVEKRMSALQTGNPEKLVLLTTLFGDRERERDLHARFARYRLEGEWFAPAPEILFELLPRRLPKQGQMECLNCGAPQIHLEGTTDRLEGDWSVIEVHYGCEDCPHMSVIVHRSAKGFGEWYQTVRTGPSKTHSRLLKKEFSLE